MCLVEKGTGLFCFDRFSGVGQSIKSLVCLHSGQKHQNDSGGRYDKRKK